MANLITNVDVYAIVNAMSKQMFGADASIQAVDTSTFVTVGEHMLRTGYTNTLDALSMVIGKTIIAARPYKGRFQIIMKTPAEWGGIERKISFYSTKNEASTDFNTNINQTTLDEGNSVDPWTISKQYPLEINFAGFKVLQKTYTTWLHQLKRAFASESDFAEFVRGRLVAIANDMEADIDAQNRLMVLNAIGATYNRGGSRQVVNLTSAFNTKYGTQYTTAQLKTTYLKEFTAFLVATIKGDMELAKEYNELFHIFPARQDDYGNDLSLNRHTPAEMRRLLLFMPLIRDQETAVFPSLFNDSYVKLENFEGVEYWQNPNEPMKVSVTPNQLNATTGQAETGNAVALDSVVGLFFDRDALAVSVKNEDVLTTQVNAKGAYYNTVYHWAYNYKMDQTENMILYYMADQ